MAGGSPGFFAQARVSALQRTIAFTQVAASRLRKTGKRPGHLLVGDQGEDAAYFYLRRLCWIVVARQWRTIKERGDIDLVGWDGTTLCFVEVKTRSDRNQFFSAEDAVDAEKRRMLRRMARAYLRRTEDPEKQPVRFDILSIYLADGRPEIEHFRDAFGWSDARKY